jgi:hypothetical protein
VTIYGLMPAPQSKTPLCDSLLVPITFEEFDKIPLGITKENDPTTRNVLTDINDRIGFNAVGPQRFNDRFKLGSIESQMFESYGLLAAFLIGVGRITWVKFQSNRAQL